MKRHPIFRGEKEKTTLTITITADQRIIEANASASAVVSVPSTSTPCDFPSLSFASFFCCAAICARFLLYEESSARILFGRSSHAGAGPTPLMVVGIGGPGVSRPSEEEERRRVETNQSSLRSQPARGRKRAAQRTCLQSR